MKLKVGDAVLLPQRMPHEIADRDALIANRDAGITTLCKASLLSFPALMAASFWSSSQKELKVTLACSAVLFAASFATSLFALFIGWFEPILRRKTKTKRFVIGPDDAGDYDDLQRAYFEEDGLLEYAHEVIPDTIIWLALNALLWVLLLASGLSFCSALFGGAIGVLRAVE